MVAQHYSIFLN